MEETVIDSIIKKRQEIIKLKEKDALKKKEHQEIEEKITEDKYSVDFILSEMDRIRNSKLDVLQAKDRCNSKRYSLIITGYLVTFGAVSLSALFDYTEMFNAALISASTYTLVSIPTYLIKTKKDRNFISKTEGVDHRINELRLKNALTKKLEEVKTLSNQRDELIKDRYEIAKILHYENTTLSMLEDSQAEKIIDGLPNVKIREKQ